MVTVFSKSFKSLINRFHMINTKHRFKVSDTIVLFSRSNHLLLIEIYTILHEKEVAPSPLKNCLPFQIVTVGSLYCFSSPSTFASLCKHLEKRPFNYLNASLHQRQSFLSLTNPTVSNAHWEEMDRLPVAHCPETYSSGEYHARRSEDREHSTDQL